MDNNASSDYAWLVGKGLGYEYTQIAYSGYTLSCILQYKNITNISIKV